MKPFKSGLQICWEFPRRVVLPGQPETHIQNTSTQFLQRKSWSTNKKSFTGVASAIVKAYVFLFYSIYIRMQIKLSYTKCSYVVTGGDVTVKSRVFIHVHWRYPVGAFEPLLAYRIAAATKLQVCCFAAAASSPEKPINLFLLMSITSAYHSCC